MKLNAEDLTCLKRFCQEVIDNPRPIHKQPNSKDGVYLWCDDWEIIEILKYLFNGKTDYQGDPPPNRLKNNPLWSKAKIEAQAERLIQEQETPQRIIDVLRRRRQNESDTPPGIS